MRTQPIRIWSEAPLGSGLTRLTPTAEERHHLDVRRFEPGQPVEVLDGQGRVAAGRLEASGVVLVERVEEVQALAPLVLLVGAGDRERFLWLVEKAVELGVTTLLPIETERSRHVANRIRAEHRDKLERRAREALKQSGGAWGLSIGALTDLEGAVGTVAEPVRWLADARGGSPNAADAQPGAAVAIGPEGGFTDREIELLEQAGFGRRRLGPRTLRFETAAAAAAAIIRYQQRERDD